MPDLNDAALIDLLKHYVEQAKTDRDAWHDRVMAGQDLSRRHGLLIAGGWLEQQTGVVTQLRPEAVPGCYRPTPAGRSAIKQLNSAPGD